MSTDSPPRKRSRLTPWSRKRVLHNHTQRILVVGEGDFSLTQALIDDTSDLSNLTTTTLRSSRQTQRDFPTAMGRIVDLIKRGATVLHGVDARKLRQNDGIRNNYDVIFFTFPLVAGLPASHPEQKKLVAQFLRSATSVLKNEGEVCVVLHVSKKGVSQFDTWNVASAATSAQLELAGKHVFDSKLFPGYTSSCADGSPFKIAGGCCYYFRRPLQKVLSVFRQELESSLDKTEDANFATALKEQVFEVDILEQNRADRQLALSTARFADGA